MSSASSERGATVLGRYVIYKEIAAGGMATVHLGRVLGAAGFARTVAIKRLHPQYAKDPEFVEMLTDEARLAARIHHPNVVTTLDVTASADELFMVMEYVHGEPLSRLLRAAIRSERRIPPPIVASIMAGALHGLHAAHEAKDERGTPLDLVHRDVSPQNIIVGADGVARVLDFGIAKAAGRSTVTRDGQVKGKLAYMPPEQLHGERLDRRADIYAAGVVLWEALVGERLFIGSDDNVDLQKMLDADVERPSARVPGLAPGFDAVTMRALGREPSDRYATAKEMAVALEACTALAPLSEVSAWVMAEVGDSLAQRAAHITIMEQTPDPSPAAPAPAPPRRRRAIYASLAIGAVLVPIAVTIAVLQRSAAPAPSDPKAPASAQEPEPKAPPASVASPEGTAAASSPERAGAGPEPTVKTKSAPPTGRKPPPRNDPCNPPFTVDEQGHKRYKRECL
jgi:eukaryotic-like serine/threonine-protein kinase